MLLDILVWLRPKFIRGLPAECLAPRYYVVARCAHLDGRAETKVVKVYLLGLFLHLLVMHDLHYFCVRPEGVGVRSCRLVG
jgi:hypothetical protein